MTRFRRALLTLGLVCCWLGGGQAGAQEASPAALPADGRDVPGPEECRVEPLTPASLLALATPAAEPGSPTLPPPRPFGAPDGDAVDAATAEAVTALIRQEWACLNGNDEPRVFALYTDDLVRRLLGSEGIVALAAGSAAAPGGSGPATPTAFPPNEQTALFAVLDIERLEDGRVGAYVVVDTFGDPLPVEVNYYLAVETDRGWLLDDFLCFDAAGRPCG